MCFGIFKKKVDIIGMPTMAKQVVIQELEDDILIHEQWAVKEFKSQNWLKTLATMIGTWIEVYKNAIYYLQGGK